jgi:hypothetical protein
VIVIPEGGALEAGQPPDIATPDEPPVATPDETPDEPLPEDGIAPVDATPLDGLPVAALEPVDGGMDPDVNPVPLLVVPVLVAPLLVPPLGAPVVNTGWRFPLMLLDAPACCKQRDGQTLPYRNVPRNCRARARLATYLQQTHDAFRHASSVKKTCRRRAPLPVSRQENK